MTVRRIEIRGAGLVVAEAEGGGPPLLLVHGWCCDRSFLAPQFAHFAARGHRVVAVDLRGHGDSDKPEGAYPIAAFADDLADLCAALDLAPVVVVGHSMGGVVAYDFAVRHAARAAAVVMIDAAVTPSPAVRAGFDATIAALAQPDCAGVMREFAGRVLFLPTDDAERRAAILARMSAAPPHVMRAAYAGLRDFDPEIGGRRLAAPALYIAAGQPSARCDLDALARLVPGLMVGRTVGAGHFCQLEVPDQVNAMIDRFLALTVDPPH